MFSRLRISSRIYAGIASLLALFLLAIAIACVGLVRLKSNVLEYAAADQLATMIDRIDRDIIELQRDVLVFAASGNESAPDRIGAIGKRIRERIAKAMEVANDDEETAYRLSEMKTRLETYLENFPEVIRDRETRESLVGETLQDLESETRPAFDQLRLLVLRQPADPQSLSSRPNLTSDEATRDAILIVEQSKSLVALAQLKALRFFDDPDVSNVRDALSLLSEAKRELSEIVHFQEESSMQADSVIELIEEYETAFLHAVQATRGYLSLVNVVMAGEASEFLYQSQQIQQRTSRESERIATETLATAGRATIAAITCALCSLFISLFVTWLVARGIVVPISAMTATFSQLMQGNNEATIPGLNRSDEIGDMARAADTFRDRNRQTEELLTQSRQLAYELDEQAKELARSNDDLNSFAYIASHDLRSPLRAIDNISSWIEEDIGEQIPAETKNHLGELRRRVRRMEQLLNELLEYSRVALKDSNTVPTNFRSVIDDAVGLLDIPADAEVIVNGAVPDVATDKGSLSRVILNLLSNAIKYRSEQPLRITCEIQLDDDIATFRFRDNGIGISPAFHARIFEMFKRLHRESEIQGTGMGLAIVKKIVEKAGGRIELESEENKGSCFTFTWPVEQIDERIAKSQADVQPKTS